MHITWVPASLIPDEFKCPVTHTILRDPVTLPSGHTFEREAWLKWTATKRGERKHNNADDDDDKNHAMMVNCPLSNELIDASRTIGTAMYLKNAIERWRTEQHIHPCTVLSSLMLQHDDSQTKTHWSVAENSIDCSNATCQKTPNTCVRFLIDDVLFWLQQPSSTEVFQQLLAKQGHAIAWMDAYGTLMTTYGNSVDNALLFKHWWQQALDVGPLEADNQTILYLVEHLLTAAKADKTKTRDERTLFYARILCQTIIPFASGTVRTTALQPIMSRLLTDMVVSQQLDGLFYVAAACVRHWCRTTLRISTLRDQQVFAARARLWWNAWNTACQNVLFRQPLSSSSVAVATSGVSSLSSSLEVLLYCGYWFGALQSCWIRTSYRIVWPVIDSECSRMSTLFRASEWIASWKLLAFCVLIRSVEEDDVLVDDEQMEALTQFLRDEIAPRWNLLQDSFWYPSCAWMRQHMREFDGMVDEKAGEYEFEWMDAIHFKPNQDHTFLQELIVSAKLAALLSSNAQTHLATWSKQPSACILLRSTRRCITSHWLTNVSSLFRPSEFTPSNWRTLMSLRFDNQTHRQYTLLHELVSTSELTDEYLNVLTYWLERGIDPSLCDEYGHSALQLLIHNHGLPVISQAHRYESCLLMLIQHGGIAAATTTAAADRVQRCTKEVCARTETWSHVMKHTTDTSALQRHQIALSCAQQASSQLLAEQINMATTSSTMRDPWMSNDTRDRLSLVPPPTPDRRRPKRHKSEPIVMHQASSSTAQMDHSLGVTRPLTCVRQLFTPAAEAKRHTQTSQAPPVHVPPMEDTLRTNVLSPAPSVDVSLASGDATGASNSMAASGMLHTLPLVAPLSSLSFTHDPLWAYLFRFWCRFQGIQRAQNKRTYHRACVQSTTDHS